MIYYSAEARGYAVMIAAGHALDAGDAAGGGHGRRRWWVALRGRLRCRRVHPLHGVFVLAAQLGWVLWAHPEARRAALIANVGGGRRVPAVAVGPARRPRLADHRDPVGAPALRPRPRADSASSTGRSAIRTRTSSGCASCPAYAALVLLAVGVLLGSRARGGARDGGGPWLERRPPDRCWCSRWRSRSRSARRSSASSGARPCSAPATSRPRGRRCALAVGALLVAAGPRAARSPRPLLAIACFAIGAAQARLTTATQRPNYKAVANFIERNAQPGDVVIDETAVLSPGPLSHARHGPGSRAAIRCCARGRPRSATAHSTSSTRS